MATAAMAAFSLAVAAGFARVFAEWQWFDNLAVLVVLGHGAGLVLRRLAIPGWIAVPVTFVLLTWAIGAIHYRFTYSSLLPTVETLDLFRSELELVREQFRTAVAPVLYGAGWDVLASIGLAGAVLLADTFAFRASARAEALVPGGVLFVFVSALGSDRLRIPLTVLLVAAGAFAVIVLRAHHSARPLPLAGRPRVSRRLVAPIGVVSALLIALLAGVVGPRLPGASAEPLYETRGRGGGSLTTVVSPLVDIRLRLTNRSDVELFVVQSNQPSYWRSSALPQFDGTTWGLPERTVRPADGTLSSDRDGSTEIRQLLRVSALTGRLLPAAPDPLAASGPGGLDWNAETSTLLTSDELTTGDEYEIVSASPRFSAASLSEATSDAPPDPIYLELPDDFGDVIRQTTVEATAGASSPYEAALFLQNWFRSEFEYSLEAQSGHGTNAIEAFLRERVGYCEQFAGTYAAMLRTIGVPTRVAVGFTPGIATAEGSYSVLGKNAHAWPEVWFDELGWVPFEPTPGRGAPGSQNYTGVPAQQDDSAVGAGGAADDGVAAVPTSIPGPSDVFEEPVPAPEDTSGDLPEVVRIEEPEPSVPWAWLIGMALIALVVAAPAVVRRIRRHTGSSPERELARLWARSLSAVSRVGVRTDPSATPIETATMAADLFPIAARPFRSLAEAVTETAYRKDGSEHLDVLGSYGSSTLRSCANWTRQIERATGDSIGTGARIKRYFTTWG